MSYQVLARKWRPRNFSELVGQPHVRKAMVNALEENRLHHAYLFTGTRGVGKTSIARIFAKCLNCETGVTATPCGECDACKSIEEGRFVDLIEVDAASRTKVDDTRELLDNVQYAPTRGRFKVYLIDEVHMLSTHSFNALLKTLEEPPPHVKFLLATTDPQKLPVTVLSRCLQFNLKRMSAVMIEDHLRHILESEQVQFEPQALSQLAKAAEGSMRDALSLMDQAIAYSAGNLRSDEVAEMLGTISNEHLYQFLDGLAQKNAALMIQTVADLAEKAPDFASVLAELIELLHQLALVQMVPDALDRTEDEQARLEALARQFHKEDLQLFYQIAMQGRRDMPVAPDPRSALEMILLRMLAFAPLMEGEEAQVTAPTSAQAKEPVVAETKPGKPALPTTSSQAAPEPQPEPEAPAAATATGDASDLNDWVSLVPRLEIVGMTKELANNCMFQSIDGSSIALGISKAKENMVTGNAKAKLESALAKYLGMSVNLQINPTDEEGVTPAANQQAIKENRQKSAEQSIMEDDFIREMQEAFDAEPVPGTVKPTK